MKLLILLLTLIPLLSNAVPPEKILPKTLVLKPLEYYSEQAQAWQNEAALRRTSAESWLNYYAASIFSQRPQEQLNEIVEAMASAVPESYELWLGRRSAFSIHLFF